jgi:excinuclease ABC subunit A
MASFTALIERGHTIVVIEHNIEIMKQADWIIDLGPEGGDRGGNLIVCGTPETVEKCKESITGQYLHLHTQQTG